MFQMITTTQKHRTNKMGHHLGIWLTTGTALTLVLANVNPILTCISLTLAITYSIYKWNQILKKK